MRLSRIPWKKGSLNRGMIESSRLEEQEMGRGGFVYRLNRLRILGATNFGERQIFERKKLKMV